MRKAEWKERSHNSAEDVDVWKSGFIPTWNEVQELCNSMKYVSESRPSGNLPAYLRSTDHKKMEKFWWKKPLSWLLSGSDTFKSTKFYQHLSNLQNWNHSLYSLHTDSNSIIPTSFCPTRMISAYTCII